MPKNCVSVNIILLSDRLIHGGNKYNPIYLQITWCFLFSCSQSLTHWCPAFQNKPVQKKWRLGSDAIFCDIWSGSTLFALTNKRRNEPAHDKSYNDLCDQCRLRSLAHSSVLIRARSHVSSTASRLPKERKAKILVILGGITKIRLFKYIENFTSKNW